MTPEQRAQAACDAVEQPVSDRVQRAMAAAIRAAEAAVHAQYAEILKAADWMDEAINAGSRSEKRWEDKPASEAYRAARAALKGG